ncbi:MAG: D-alanyl-D-alanine carboxypeptidase family protein [Xanthomonadales bacterium]|nr:D-alanyl-D-alanine carboxypeptidase family protein [Xanthomonadales bacterium]
MSIFRIDACKQPDLKELRLWLISRENLALTPRQPGLEGLVEDQCLLLARSTSNQSKASIPGKILGVAGLDLELASICLLALDRSSDLPDLLTALERLAVSFGMLELRLDISPGNARKLKLAAYPLSVESQKIRQRQLKRRLTPPARKALQLNQRLGVPGDYGCAHRLRLQAEPSQLASIGLDVFNREQFMTPKAAKALHQLIHAAAAEHIAIQPVSAFRSVDYQGVLLQNKLDKGQSMEEILRVSAAPGFSEHHSGRAVDLTTPNFKPLEEEFADSAAFTWLSQRAGEFGFRMSYPKSNRHGVTYEPWHWYYFN